MMQPGSGVAPSALVQQYGQQPPPQQPNPAQPYMMMPPPPLAGVQPPQAMWAPPPQAQPASSDEIRTLWIGDLQYWMEENYLYNIFATTGEVVSVKVIRNKQTSQCEGYGFIEFVSRAAAERVLQTFNGATMPNYGQPFRLNWASAGEKRADDTPDYTIFVGDLAVDVTDYILQEVFKARYPSCKGAKVVIDRLTGRTKGYGFVKFGDESEQLRAMTEMNGVVCSSRPMRIGPAANKNAGGNQQYSKASYQSSPVASNETDPNNTTIFVGNLDANVTDDILRTVFGHYGELVHVKIPAGKHCGFVQFAERSRAEEALQALNNSTIGGQNIRLSWVAVLQTSSRLRQIQANGKLLVIMDMHQPLKDMHILKRLQTLTCTTEVTLLDTEITSSRSSNLNSSSSNNSNKSVIVECRVDPFPSVNSRDMK